MGTEYTCGCMHFEFDSVQCEKHAAESARNRTIWSRVIALVKRWVGR